MKNRKPAWLALETVIILGLCIKLVLSSFFLASFQGSAVLAGQTGVAHAQEKKDEEAPKAEGEEKAEGEQQPTPPAPNADKLGKQFKAMVEALQKREAAVKEKENLIRERSKALDALQKELAQRMAEIELTRKKLDDLVKKHEQLVEQQKILRDERIEHLVTAYKGMRPEKAGVLVDSLDDDVAVQILAAMPGRSAGQILAYVNPEKAARLTKAISDMKKDGVPINKPAGQQ